jgi:hypothetical protein
VSKGDSVTVHTDVIGPLTVTATKNGRSVTVARGAMTVVSEVTRGGRTTGNAISVKAAHVVAIEEHRAFDEPPVSVRKERKGLYKQEPLALE